MIFHVVGMVCGLLVFISGCGVAVLGGVLAYDLNDPPTSNNGEKAARVVIVLVLEAAAFGTLWMSLLMVHL